MLITIKKILLIGVMISFVHVKSYAEDKKYYLDDANSQQPNYNDPSKPNYMSGTRTDMAPKVEIEDKEQDNKKKDDRCIPPEEIQTIVVNAYDSRYDNSPAGVTSLPQVIGASKLWDEECKKQKQEKERQKLEKMPSHPAVKSAE